MSAAKVWNGSSWEIVGGNLTAQVQAAAPAGPAVGQLWMDDNKQLFIYDGTAWVRDGQQTLGNLQSRRIMNLVVFEQTSANIAGYLVIQTPIAFDNVMMDLHIHGFNYVAGANTIDLHVSGYTYSGTSAWATTGAVNYGTFPVSQVRLMKRTSDGLAAIVITSGNASNYWQYPKIVVDGVFGHSNTVEAAGAWSASITTDLTAYGGSVTVSLADVATKDDIDAFTGSEGVIWGSVPPAGTKRIIRQATAVVSCNASGNAPVSFYSSGFSNGIVSVVANSGDYNAYGGSLAILAGSNGTYFNVHTNPIVTGNIRVNYIAVGW